ncbi:peptidoglycan-binding protein [Caulobacter segnis]|uniref:peptidoglycan-binding protein n=1 Tax=Caulobacter segnis TaxID=88688 RepID=UPI00240EE96A|nr:peptidoglycan-binding protein [Caulobacter segnis]MDG2523179.1 peptidoglycan-binding protein [Caulobacter segnis]
MSAGAPWSVKGIDPKAREIAKDLARRSGMTLGEWLNRMILEDDAPDFGDSGYGARPQGHNVLDHPRSQRESSRFDASGYPIDDSGRIALALERLSDRIEAAEARQARAVTGIDHSVRNVIARLETSERDAVAVASRFEGAIADLGEEQRHIADRMRRMEQGGADAASTEAIKTLEGAIGKLAGQVYDTDARTKAALDGVKASAGKVDTDALVEAVVARVAQRLEAAESKTADALLELSASFITLDERLKAVEGGAGLGGEGLGALAADLSRRMEAARAEMTVQLEKSAGGRLNSLEASFHTLQSHVEAAERRSTGALERMGREVMSIAGAMNARIKEVEDRNADAVEKMGAEIARVAATTDGKLARADLVQAQALERLGGEIARITERLSERIATAEQRNARAIDDVGEQVARVGERLTERQERVTSELTDRIRQSEERTARLLEEAREKVDAGLQGARRRLADPIVEAPFEAPAETLAPAPEASSETTAFVSEGDGAGSFSEGRFSFSEVGVEDSRPPLTAQTFARPAEPAPAPKAAAEPEPIELTSLFEPADPVEHEDAHAARSPDDIGFTDEDFDAADGFIPLHESEDAADSADLFGSGQNYLLTPDADPEPVRVLSTREAVEQARAAARAAQSPSETRPFVLASSGHSRSIFSGLMGSRRGGRRAGSSMQTVAFFGAGVALLGMMTTGLVMSNQNPGKASKSDETAPTSLTNARAAVAIATPNIASSMAPVVTEDQTKAYEAAVRRIEAGDDAALAPLRNIAEAGHPAAQFYLAKLYENGEAGLKANPAEARRWTERAAQGGDRKAMHNLALYYFEGQGGQKNPAVAAEWFRKAADLGLVDSQYNLGRIYEAGFGVAANEAEAYKWYLIAGRAGDDEARASAVRLKPKLSAEVQATAERAANGFRAAGSAAPASATASAGTATSLVTAQKALARLGYYQGAQDGVSSPALRLAIAAYQRDQGLSSTGKADPELVARLAAFAQ